MPVCLRITRSDEMADSWDLNRIPARNILIFLLDYRKKNLLWRNDSKTGTIHASSPLPLVSPPYDDESFQVFGEINLIGHLVEAVTVHHGGPGEHSHAFV
jgi:hypothetical protein